MALVPGELETLLLFIIIVVGFVVLARTAYMLIRYYLDVRTKPSYVAVISRFAQYAIIAAGLYVGFASILHLDLVAVAASLGIITIVAALSAQPVLSNAVAGVLIAIGRPFNIDEWVEIGASGPCVVRDMNMTYTFLRSELGTVVTIPNSAILSSKIINYSRTCLIQVPINVEVPLEADFGRVAMTILSVLDAHPLVLPTVPEEERSLIDRLLRSSRASRVKECERGLIEYEPKLLITNVTPSSIFIEVRLWIREIERRDAIKSEIMSALLRELKPLERRPPAAGDRKEDLVLESLERLTAELRAMNERSEQMERTQVRGR